MKSKQHKVWIAVEEYDPNTDKHQDIGEPMDLNLGESDPATAGELASLLHHIGESIQASFENFKAPSEEDEHP